MALFEAPDVGLAERRTERDAPEPAERRSDRFERSLDRHRRLRGSAEHHRSDCIRPVHLRVPAASQLQEQRASPRPPPTFVA